MFVLSIPSENDYCYWYIHSACFLSHPQQIKHLEFCNNPAISLHLLIYFFQDCNCYCNKSSNTLEFITINICYIFCIFHHISKISCPKLLIPVLNVVAKTFEPNLTYFSLAGRNRVQNKQQIDSKNQ